MCDDDRAFRFGAGYGIRGVFRQHTHALRLALSAVSKEVRSGRRVRGLAQNLARFFECALARSRKPVRLSRSFSSGRRCWLSAAGAAVAQPSARCQRATPPAYGPPAGHARGLRRGAAAGRSGSGSRPQPRRHGVHRRHRLRGGSAHSLLPTFTGLPGLHAFSQPACWTWGDGGTTVLSAGALLRPRSLRQRGPSPRRFTSSCSASSLALLSWPAVRVASPAACPLRGPVRLPPPPSAVARGTSAVRPTSSPSHSLPSATKCSPSPRSRAADSPARSLCAASTTAARRRATQRRGKNRRRPPPPPPPPTARRPPPRLPLPRPHPPRPSSRPTCSQPSSPSAASWATMRSLSLMTRRTVGR